MLQNRRVFPALQMVYNTLTVTRDTTNSIVTVAFRPNNCTINLTPSALRQAVSNVRNAVCFSY